MTETNKIAGEVKSVGGDLPDELVHLFARQGKRVPVPVFLCSLLLASMAWNQLGGWLPWFWLMAVTLILAIRWNVLGSLPASPSSSNEKLRVAVLLSGINGIVQGASIGFAVLLDTPERAVHTIVLLGLCAGSVATTGGYRPAFVAFVAPTILPLSIMWAIGAPGVPHRWVEYSTGALILVFGMVLLSLADDAFRLLKESFRIRQEQVVLNRQLRLLRSTTPRLPTAPRLVFWLRRAMTCVNRCIRSRCSVPHWRCGRWTARPARSRFIWTRPCRR